ncbi:MAG: LD-carboxypeptidase [Flavobacteriales bacterium]|nr:LD-carboxypeptidase [Flavobacteriales bacterium]
MKKLPKNPTIGIIAPAGAVKKEDLQPTLELIKSKNWNYKLSKNLYNLYQFGYNYSGTEKQRISDLQNALDDDSIDVIWCARGGYGGAQIIDSVNFRKFKKNPKYLIGYSDNTVLHQAINKLGIPSLHGNTIKVLPSGNTEESYESVFNCLENQSMNYEICTHELNTLGKSEGILVGGNLSIIYSLLGSKTITKFKNKILFLEDWNENFYHIDRMITCLKRAGIFNKINGLIFGGFTKLDDKEENFNFNLPFDPFATKLLRNLIGKTDFPVCFEFPAGHIPDNRCLIMGSKVELNIESEKTTLKTI